MTFIVIGSTAARYHLGDRWREPKDYDVFTDRSPQPDEKLDAFWVGALNTYEGWRRQTRHATLDELYTIKLSHSYWELPNGSWNKHVFDMVKLQDHGAKVIDELYKVLYKVWEEKHGRKTINLDLDKAAFFDDAVPRKWDHDSIHMSVAYGDTPIYESILKPDAEVGIDMRALKALPFDTQVKLFREEIYATALERLVIPRNYAVSPRACYGWALRRTMTRLTRGWSARFIAENYKVFRDPDMDYVAHHLSKAHLLVPFERKGK